MDEDDVFENLPEVENLPDVAPDTPTTADETADIGADEPQAKRLRGAGKTMIARKELGSHSRKHSRLAS